MGSDINKWQIYVCEDYGPINSVRVLHVAGWEAMVEAVRIEIELCGRSGDQAAKTDAADLLDWLDSHYITRDCSLRLTFVHEDRATGLTNHFRCSWHHPVPRFHVPGR